MFHASWCLLVTEGGLEPEAVQTRLPRAAGCRALERPALTPAFRARFALPQEEEAGAAAPADGLLLPAVEDLQLKLLLPLQVLRPAGCHDAGEHGPGDAECFPGTVFSLHLIWGVKPRESESGLQTARPEPEPRRSAPPAGDTEKLFGPSDPSTERDLVLYKNTSRAGFSWCDNFLLGTLIIES